MVEHEVTAALAAWGAHHRDDLFALFADAASAHPSGDAGRWPRSLARGPSRQARAALNDPRLSKDMHAALVADAAVVSEGLPGPASPDTCSPSILRTTPGSAGWSPAPSPRKNRGATATNPAIVDDLLDGIAADDPDSPIDLVSRFAFPLPFTGHLRAVRARARSSASVRGLTGLLARRRRRSNTPRPSWHPTLPSPCWSSSSTSRAAHRETTSSAP